MPDKISGRPPYAGRRYLLPMPEQVTRDLSRQAVQLARSKAPKRTGYGARNLRPTTARNRVGINVPPRAYYMMIQNQGFEPFIMWALEGKSIPMQQPDGSIQFRVAKDVGKRVIVSRDSQGRINQSKIKWRHPGLKPKLFIQKSIAEVLQTYLSSLDDRSAVRLLKQSLKEAASEFGEVA